MLTTAAAQCPGEQAGHTMRLAADRAESLTLPACGHSPTEEVPAAPMDALTRS
ncbi:hypothetical protein [Streptomyces sp. NBC_00344]|uniref:hypothetical protein n=1 Tax=Streptomyces sp. NBC_00344 TaxID=2975720 RepID=UPI002E1DE89E